MLQPPLEVLVAEDSKEVSEVVAHCLKAQGYAVTCAETGRDAIRFLQNQYFDVVVTDVIMPDADGLEVIAVAKSRYPRTRIVVITGGGDVVDPQYCATLATRMGAHAAVLKPFRPEVLIETVERVVRTDGES